MKTQDTKVKTGFFENLAGKVTQATGSTPPLSLPCLL